MDSKSSQRAYIKKLRENIDKDIYDLHSEMICEKLLKLKQYVNANSILAYYPINNEVDTLILLNHIIENKTLSLPKTDITTNSIQAKTITDLNRLKVGAYSIMEPKASCKNTDLDRIDLVIIPLVAFDKKCARLGYGGGYYDRLLSKMPHCMKIGLAFELQKVDHILSDSHDISLDIIITEKNTYIR